MYVPHDAFVQDVHGLMSMFVNGLVRAVCEVCSYTDIHGT